MRKRQAKADGVMTSAKGIGWGGVAGGTLSALGLVPWVLDMAGVDTSGVLVPYLPAIFGVLHVVSPFAVFIGGFIVGWFVCDRQISRDAEAVEKIRREREDREREAREREYAERARQLEEQRRKGEADNAVSNFKTLAKLNDALVMICMAIVNQGGSMLLSAGLAKSIGEEDCYIPKMFDYTPKGGDACEVSLGDWAMLALESDGGLLHGYDQRDCRELERALVEDAEQVARDRGAR